ncbi:28S ribosomal protein S31, mitochondrial [Thalassophryne amazonica]|uniref:28S ribosomal protein S31, mitochondrial n=1 Tax=Thalassophryne amazonica TaxID=390379 RepID=UPI001470FB30|nr:28S ribosomal protein S31, mitochondrial [Thalassophryne amazonica]
MYKWFLRTVFTARSFSHGLYELCVLSGGCDTATVIIRAANGSVRTFSTRSARLCKLDNSVPFQEDVTSNATKEPESTETSSVVEQKSDYGNKLIGMDKQREESVEVKAADESVTQQNDVEKDVEKGKWVMTETDGSKNSLVELLRTMKVDVTSKKRGKSLQKTLFFESAPNQKSPDKGSITSKLQKAKVEASAQSKTLDHELVSAASAAASTLPNHSQAQSELLRQLRKQKDLTEAQRKAQMDLGVIIADMKVVKKAAFMKTMNTAMNQIQFDDDGHGYKRTGGGTAQLGAMTKKKHLFSRTRLNIFSVTDEGVDSAIACPTLWDLDFAHQLSQSVNQKPRNRLEEMIQWTKEGKLWQYPVNNEAGLEEEAAVPFHEHVFLEKHLEEGFPSQGPVRHFMELVVAGLSRNPYLTVQQKKEHILWFREYFKQKDDIINEAEAEFN